MTAVHSQPMPGISIIEATTSARVDVAMPVARSKVA
jgi:hypothetical protein